MCIRTQEVRTGESHSSCLVFPLNRFYFLRRSYFGKDAQSGIILRGRVSLLLPRTERVPDESLSFATLKGKKVREETPLDKRGNCEKPREFREKERDKGNESAKHQKKSEIGTEREGDEETCRHLTQPRTAQGGGRGGGLPLCSGVLALSPSKRAALYGAARIRIHRAALVFGEREGAQIKRIVHLVR